MATITTTTTTTTTTTQQAASSMGEGEPPTRLAPVSGAAYSTFSGDGREERLLASLLARREELQGNPQAVLDAIDGYAEGGEYLMNVGKDKGEVVEDVIRQSGAKLILELGTYVGYSAIKFARHLLAMHPDGVYPSSWPTSPPSPASSSSEAVTPTQPKLVGYICLEKSPSYSTVARSLLSLAGLDKVAHILTGPSTLSILHLHTLLPALKPGTQFDLVFLDHHKPHYTMDLKALEEGGWIGKGTVCVADNVVKPGNPRYLAYVRGKPPRSGSSSTTKEEARGVGEEEEDEVEEVDEETGTVITGVRGIRYESRMVMSWDPYTGEDDAVEISTCVEVEDDLPGLEVHSCA